MSLRIDMQANQCITECITDGAVIFIDQVAAHVLTDHVVDLLQICVQNNNKNKLITRYKRAYLKTPHNTSQPRGTVHSKISLLPETLA